jgi:hypothetical protein
LGIGHRESCATPLLKHGRRPPHHRAKRDMSDRVISLGKVDQNSVE